MANDYATEIISAVKSINSQIAKQPNLSSPKKPSFNELYNNWLPKDNPRLSESNMSSERSTASQLPADTELRSELNLSESDGELEEIRVSEESQSKSSSQSKNVKDASRHSSTKNKHSSDKSPKHSKRKHDDPASASKQKPTSAEKQIKLSVVKKWDTIQQETAETEEEEEFEIRGNIEFSVKLDSKTFRAIRSEEQGEIAAVFSRKFTERDPERIPIGYSFYLNTKTGKIEQE